MQKITTNSAPSAIGAYSQAIVAHGFVFCSGQLGIDPMTGELVAGDAAAQAAQAMKNISALLDAAGSGMCNIVKATIFLTDMADFAAVNEVYARALGDVRPARSCVFVAALPKGARVEIEVLALAR